MKMRTAQPQNTGVPRYASLAFQFFDKCVDEMMKKRFILLDNFKVLFLKFIPLFWIQWYHSERRCEGVGIHNMTDNKQRETEMDETRGVEYLSSLLQ